MKKIVVFGGGTGISNLLAGLKLFPVDVTTVIAISDNGSSTGVLKEELDIPAVGDIGKVLLSMANVDSDFLDLLGYRFSKEGTLHNHPVRNIIMAALIDTKGSLTEATKYMSKLLNIKGTVLPLSEERVELVGKGRFEEEYYGEEDVSRNALNIEHLTYDHDIHVGREIIEAIREADLLIFSPGSLYTSILPHLLAEEVVRAINESVAPIVYVSNLVTQPGETDGYNVGKHVSVINKYLGERKVDLVIANNGKIDEAVRRKYLDAEGKQIVLPDDVDPDTEIIAEDIFVIEDGKIRHDELKTAYLIFSYLMRESEGK